MTFKTMARSVVAAAAMLVVAGAAQAAAGYCSDTADGTTNTHTDGVLVEQTIGQGKSKETVLVPVNVTLMTSDVTYSITGAAPYTNAKDCYGIARDIATDQAGETNFVNSLVKWQDTPTNNFTFLDKSDSATGASLLNLTWTLSLTFSDSTADTYTLSSSQAINPAQYFDFVVLQKQANGHVAYFFDEVLFDGSAGGTWQVKIPNKNGEGIGDVSHISVLGRTNGKTPPDNDVPEPGTLALAGLALLGVAAARRRRQA